MCIQKCQEPHLRIPFKEEIRKVRKKYKDEWFFNFPTSRGKDKGEERQEKRELVLNRKTRTED